MDVPMWMSNLLGGGGLEVPPVDELEVIRKEAEKAEKEAAERREEIAKKEKKTEKKKKREASSSSGRKTKRLRVKAKKPVEALFEDTGLDPAPKTRRRFWRHAKRRTKKKKKSKKGSSKSSLASSSSEGKGGSLEG